jgi:uroporphyrinogen-III synthase
MILITRPKEQSKNLETILGFKGYETYLESLYKIKYLKVKISHNKNNYYIFPSIHSVQSLINSKQIKKFQEANIIAIGNKVKQALINVGCTKIILTSIDSDTLVKKINKTNFRNYNFIYLCSNIVNTEFLKKTEKYQISIKIKIIYKTIPSIKFQNKLINNLKLGNISGATFLSKLAADTFLCILIRYNCLIIAKEMPIYCISKRVAASFKKANFKFVYIASMPNENALIKSIKKRHFA